MNNREAESLVSLPDRHLNPMSQVRICGCILTRIISIWRPGNESRQSTIFSGALPPRPLKDQFQCILCFPLGIKQCSSFSHRLSKSIAACSSCSSPHTLLSQVWTERHCRLLAACFWSLVSDLLDVWSSNTWTAGGLKDGSHCARPRHQTNEPFHSFTPPSGEAHYFNSESLELIFLLRSIICLLVTASNLFFPLNQSIQRAIWPSCYSETWAVLSSNPFSHQHIQHSRWDF